MSKKITLIKLLILLGYVGVPLNVLFLFSVSSHRKEHVFFLVFMLFHSFERVWETFYTTKERKSTELHGDWTLVVVTVMYIVLCLVFTFEFFLWPRAHSVGITILGLILYLIAFRMRWWGMSALGKQWAIHAVGVQKIKKVRLIRHGPYRYVRHPIYLAVMIELLSLPIIANAPISLVMSIFINIPLQYTRLLLEEQSSTRRFGEKYQQYKQEVDMLFPFKLLKNIFK